MENEKRNHICQSGVDCSYMVRRNKIYCRANPPPDYFTAELLEARTSDFHTDALSRATTAINEVLSQIPEDSEGRMPAFIQTRMGIMLAWVEHTAEPLAADEDGDVTSAADDGTLAKALNLKNYS